MKMFKNRNYAFGTAALLLGAMAFSSCSSDETENVNPSFDGESVKTQFAVNIPRAEQGKTRMTSGNTQATTDNEFLGMQDLRLYPFTAAATNETAISSVITLPELTTNDIYGTSSNRSSKIYNDVTIPVGTTNFLFYGQAKRQTAATDFANGNLATTFGNALTKVEDINFNLVDILAEGTKPESNEQATSLIGVLNGVAQVENWSSQIDGTELKNLYGRFIDLKAGSAASVTAALQSLYNAASKLHTTEGDIAGNIMTKITEGSIFEAVQDGETHEYTLTYNKEGDEMFPRNLNLPDGAVALTFTSDKFGYVTSNQVIGDPNKPNTISVSNVVYPASLYYFASTTLRASDNSVAADAWPTTTTDWTNGFKDADGWKGTVLATTRSIAMTDNINYGVGNLALSVQAAAATLHDRTYNGAQRDITVGSETFPIKAILIGGQPTKAGFDFKPATGATFTKTIYDKVEDGKYANYISGGGIADVCNYTLALPNVQDTPAKIQFAIELENNSDTEFVGYNDQIIYKGSKFYLIGYLDPNAEGGNVNGGADKDGNPKNVFESDYMTRAKVSIKSLENAYNVIPDLRSTNLEFGLSVDLEWKKGLTFDVTID